MGKGRAFSDYPKHVFLILGNEFCERFSFYGMKAILVIFLTRALLYSDDDATAIYHGFNMACYFTPIFGAVLADGFIGKYKTILYISLIYVVGNTVMALSSIPFGGSYTNWATFIGLGLIGLGTGGIKPCVNAFGADQFRDDQTKEKDSFFSMFYVSINMGSLMSMILTPILRSSVSCFDDDCYALAFGVPAALMLMALFFFLLGTKMYNITPPGNNVIGKMIGCTYTAIKGKITSKEESRDHWLDYADVKYEEEFIDDVKKALKVMLMFVTFPIFYALYDQQGSRWILQAGQMDGDLGFFIIEPDLVPVVNPILVLILVPLCETVLYPLFDRCKFMYTALQRVGFGMFLTAMAFIITACVQIAINASEPAVVAVGHSRITAINAAPCAITITNENDDKWKMALEYQQEAITTDMQSGTETFTATYTNCGKDSKSETNTLEVVLDERKTYPLVFAKINDNLEAKAFEQKQTVRTPKGQSMLMLINTLEETVKLVIVPLGESAETENIIEIGSMNSTERPLPPGNFDVYRVTNAERQRLTTDKAPVKSRAGAVDAYVIQRDETEEKVIGVTHGLITPNSISVFLQLPQYFIMTLAEVFFIITSMNFAYSQAPMTMKAVLQAANLLTSTFGNLIVVIISGSQLSDRVFEFFLFAGLMLATLGIFMVMAHFYEYVDMVPDASDDDDEKDKDGKKGDDLELQDIERVEKPRAISHPSLRLTRSRTSSSLKYLGESTKL